MNFTALKIAKKLNGTIEGNADAHVTNLAKIEDASKGSLSFLDNPKYIPFLNDTKASVVLVSKKIKLKRSTKTTLIRVENAYTDFTKLLIELSKSKQRNYKGIHPSAIIDSTASLAKEVYIGPYVVIGAKTKIHNGARIHANCTIGSEVILGENSLIMSNVSLMDETEIGNFCTIHSGAIIGSDGFGYVINEKGSRIKIPHLGKVIIKDEVEIGANTTIDRATMGATIIHKGVKLDNLVQIAHNVEIGPNTVIAAQSGVAGSTKIGAGCTIGGQVGIIGHLVIGDEVKIQGQTGVISNIPNGKIIQGTPALDFNSFYKSYTIFKHLPDFQTRIGKLEKKVNS